jgi:hypothetical protein
MVLTMAYNTWDYKGFLLFPSSDILKTTKHLKIGSLSILK